MRIKEKYKGFSLIELLLTMMILGVISLLVGVTLNTIIRVSNSTNSKNLARNDANYIMDIVKRTVSNAQLEDVYLFNSSSRKLDYTGGVLGVSLDSNPYTDPGKEDMGNEMHVKLYGYDTWSCIGYFKDDLGYGYIVQSTVRGLNYEADTCISSSNSITILHSLTMDVPSFEVSYIDIGDGENSMFDVSIEVKPLFWPLKQNILVKPSVYRRSVISTEALTWY